MGEHHDDGSSPDYARFAAKVRVLDAGCHVWQAALDSDGYGKVWLNGKVVYAHRLAYERLNGPIPAGMQCDHICKVRHCVNPRHLQIVTPEQNSMLARVRAGDADIRIWERALDDGLAVELTDLEATGRRANRARQRTQD